MALSDAVAVYHWIEEINEEQAATFATSVKSHFQFASMFGASDAAASKAEPQQNGQHPSEVRDTA